MFFDTETIGTPGCKCCESTQANESSQWAKVNCAQHRPDVRSVLVSTFGAPTVGVWVQ